MKKTLLFLIMTVFALSFVACSSSDDDVTPSGSTVKLTAVFQFKSGEEIKPSAGTRMFIFKATESTTNWVYNNETHTFKNSAGAVVNPTYTLKANEGGLIEANIDANTSYIYAYEPGINPSKYGIERFETKNDPIDILKTH